MASTINASTTLGLQQTADTSGILKLQTASTDALTLDASQNATFAGTVRTAAYTVATLPAAGTAGRRAYVTNALTPVTLSAVVGGGAVTVPVFDNGTTWIVG
jgi:L-rhamnose isomerase